MRIGADEGIGVGDPSAIGLLGAEDAGGEVFEVHLVDDAGIGRHGAEVTEGGLAPAEQHVALAIALEFEQRVDVESLVGAVFVDLDGVVNDEVGGHERVGFGGVFAHGGEGIAHGGEIDHAGDAREILQQDAGGHEGDLLVVTGGAACDCFNVRGLDALAVFLAEQVFEQDLVRKRQGRDVDAVGFKCSKTVKAVFLTARLQRGFGAKTVLAHELSLC